MSLKEKLVILRKQKGLTQMDLAEQLNVSRQAISGWEVGAAVPSTDNLKVLSNLYGVPVDYFLNDNITENVKSIREAEDNPINMESVSKRTKNKSIIICAVVVVILTIILICLLTLQNEDSDQFVPMNDMYVETEGDYSDGTFMIE